MVGPDEIRWDIYFGFRIPFEFKPCDFSARFFHIINLLLLFCPPKIDVAILFVVMISLRRLRLNEVSG